MTGTPNTHWFTKSAVDELTAGLRATLEARTAALTRTIERAEAAEGALADLRAHPVVTTKQISDMHESLVEQIGRGIDPAVVRKAVEHAGLAWDRAALEGGR